MLNLTFLFVLVNTILVYRICKSKRVHLFLKLQLCISFFGWNAIPALFIYFPQLVEVDYISESFIRCNYLNQTFLFFVYLFSYILIKSKKRTSSFVYKKDFQDYNQLFRFFLYLSIFLMTYKCYTLFTVTHDYLERNNIENAQTTSFLGFFTSYAIYYVICSVLFFRSKIPSPLYYICLALVISYYLLLVFQGGRIYLFGIVLILLYLALQRKSKSLIIVSAIFGLFSLSLLPAISSLRGISHMHAAEVLELSKSSTEEMILNSILGKTSSVRSGNYLIENDGIGNQGLKMYTSTLYALIPRTLYPSKPEPGSVDGEITGLPSRRSAIYSVEGEYNGILNLGVPASLSSLWGGGWIAYIAEIISLSFLLYLLNCIFYSRKFVFLCFALQIISFPVCILEVPLPSILIYIQRDFVIYLLLYFFLHKSFVKY